MFVEREQVRKSPIYLPRQMELRRLVATEQQPMGNIRDNGGIAKP